MSSSRLIQHSISYLFYFELNMKSAKINFDFTTAILIFCSDSENSSKGRKRSLSKWVNNEDTLLVSDPSRVDSITPNSSLNKTSKWYNPTCKTKSSNAVNLNWGGLRMYWISFTQKFWFLTKSIVRKKSIIYKPKSKVRLQCSYVTDSNQNDSFAKINNDRLFISKLFAMIILFNIFLYYLIPLD